jgi:hypothetical protein
MAGRASNILNKIIVTFFLAVFNFNINSIIKKNPKTARDK